MTTGSLDIPDLMRKAREPRLPVARPDKIEDGETVAATIIDRQETKVARYFDEGDFIRLQPLNPYMAPLYELRTNVYVQARVVAVIRLHR